MFQDKLLKQELSLKQAQLADVALQHCKQNRTQVLMQYLDGFLVCDADKRRLLFIGRSEEENLILLRNVQLAEIAIEQLPISVQSEVALLTRAKDSYVVIRKKNASLRKLPFVCRQVESFGSEALCLDNFGNMYLIKNSQDSHQRLFPHMRAVDKFVDGDGVLILIFCDRSAAGVNLGGEIMFRHAGPVVDVCAVEHRWKACIVLQDGVCFADREKMRYVGIENSTTRLSKILFFHFNKAFISDCSGEVWMAAFSVQAMSLEMSLEISLENITNSTNLKNVTRIVKLSIECEDVRHYQIFVDANGLYWRWKNLNHMQPRAADNATLHAENPLPQLLFAEFPQLILDKKKRLAAARLIGEINALGQEIYAARLEPGAKMVCSKNLQRHYVHKLKKNGEYCLSVINALQGQVGLAQLAEQNRLLVVKTNVKKIFVNPRKSFIVFASGEMSVIDVYDGNCWVKQTGIVGAKSLFVIPDSQIQDNCLDYTDFYLFITRSCQLVQYGECNQLYEEEIKELQMLGKEHTICSVTIYFSDDWSYTKYGSILCAIIKKGQESKIIGFLEKRKISMPNVANPTSLHFCGNLLLIGNARREIFAFSPDGEGMWKPEILKMRGRVVGQIWHKQYSNIVIQKKTRTFLFGDCSKMFMTIDELGGNANNISLSPSSTTEAETSCREISKKKTSKVVAIGRIIIV